MTMAKTEEGEGGKKREMLSDERKHTDANKAQIRTGRRNQELDDPTINRRAMQRRRNEADSAI
ncbi:hypothetical protein CCMA1212_009467 [Trichoderma ghanense]|uniref:IBB domain-containing protein n=1 Tax=Trichoderma ghanense TaxID=65468 RepID=A0ABY2GS68_9HYPO